jgi:hypothetical protein
VSRNHRDNAVRQAGVMKGTQIEELFQPVYRIGAGAEGLDVFTALCRRDGHCSLDIK